MKPGSMFCRIRARGLPRRCWLLTLLLLLAVPEAFAGTEAVRVMDDRGREVRLPAPARRVVGLYATFSELLLAMDLGELLVARTNADDSPGAAHLPAIGTHMRPNIELVLSLSPDLVLQMGGRSEALDPLVALERHGVPCAFFTVADFEDLFSVIRRLGVLTGEEDRADSLVRSLEARLEQVARSVDSRTGTGPRIFFEARHPNLLAAGADSMAAEIIRRAGGRNAVRLPGRVVRFSEEELLRLDPDIYLYQRGPMNPNPTPPSRRPHYRHLSAVRGGRVLPVDEAAYSRPGPANVGAVEELAAALAAFGDNP